jgi:hypothetical protein
MGHPYVFISNVKIRVKNVIFMGYIANIIKRRYIVPSATEAVIANMVSVNMVVLSVRLENYVNMVKRKMYARFVRGLAFASMGDEKPTVGHVGVVFFVNTIYKKQLVKFVIKMLTVFIM